MSARIRSIKANIAKNKNTQIFSKTMTSNFKKSFDKSPKKSNEFGMTKTTGFSDDLTNTIASSIRTISKFKSMKKEKPIFLNLEDFHKQYLLNKNKDNDTILGIYTQNGYNTLYNNIKLNYINNARTLNNRSIKLKKKSASPSFFGSLSTKESKNRMQNKKNKDNQSNSQISSFFENKYKNKTLYLNEISKISKNKINNTNSHSNNYSDEYYQNYAFKNIFTPSESNEFDPILKLKKYNKDLNAISNINTNILNTNYIKNTNSNYNFNISNSKNSMNEKKKIKKGMKFNYYNGRNALNLNDQLAYPSFNSYLFARAKRYENTDQFMYKTRLMVMDKYIKNVIINTHLKQLTLNENTFENQTLNQRSLELKKKLFNSYKKTFDDYLKFLFLKFRKMNEENEELKQNIIKISIDIENMRQKIIRDLNVIKEGNSIKFFLMCVKNHTLSVNKFAKEHIEIIENDKLKLNENISLISPKTKKTDRKNSRRKNTIIFLNKIKKIQTHSSGKSLTLKGNPFSNNNNYKRLSNNSLINSLNDETKGVPLTIFNSVEEFLDNFDTISSKLDLLIKENNDKYANLTYLKMQLSNITKSTEGQRKDSILLKKKIKEYELNLEDLKNKNKILSTELNSHLDTKNKNDVKIILVLKKIYSIYINIKKYTDISYIKKDDIITFGRDILKVIENFFLNMLDKVYKDKIKYPTEYEQFKLLLDKRKKQDAFIIFQSLLAQKIEIKIEAVLRRASKVIYKRLRKTNDYQKYRNANKSKKKERKKTDIELFFEYLDKSED